MSENTSCNAPRIGEGSPVIVSRYSFSRVRSQTRWMASAAASPFVGPDGPSARTMRMSRAALRPSVEIVSMLSSLGLTRLAATASALASAVEAQQAGDLQRAAEWEARAAGIWAEIEQSVRSEERRLGKEGRSRW